ncbi:Putative ribonuclease H protein At1g65750, partial [Linum perenne]
LAWDKGIRKLCVQTDSKVVVTLILDSDNRSHRHTNLIKQIHILKNRDWDVTINHICREANNAADYLAKP